MRHVRVIHHCDDDVRQSDCADNCSSVIIMTWFPCILHSGSLCVVVTRLGHDHLYSYPPHIDPSLLPQSHTPSHHTFYTPSPHTLLPLHTDSGEYSTVAEANASLLGKPIHPKEVHLENKIGEGQFGDVHKGVLYPNVCEMATIGNIKFV